MKNLVKSLITVLALGVPVVMLAQTYPSRPVKLIVPFPPGGAADVIARAFSVPLAESLGQPVVLDNRPGADTIIGMEVTARSPADGYTLVLALNSALTMNPALYAKLPYDDSKDFAPISIVAHTPLALVVPGHSPAKTAAELGAMMKAKPNAYSYGAGNIVARVGAEAMLSQAGGKAVPIMYKGSGPTLIDLMRGEIQFSFEPIVAAMPHVKSGKLRALGVVMNKRSALAPEVATMAESGMPGFDLPVWFGFMAPAGTPREVVSRIQSELAKASRSPELREKLAAMGVEITSSTPEQFAATVASERDVWLKKIRDMGIKIE